MVLSLYSFYSLIYCKDKHYFDITHFFNHFLDEVWS